MSWPYGLKMTLFNVANVAAICLGAVRSRIGDNDSRPSGQAEQVPRSKPALVGMIRAEGLQ